MKKIKRLPISLMLISISLSFACSQEDIVYIDPEPEYKSFNRSSEYIPVLDLPDPKRVLKRR